MALEPPPRLRPRGLTGQYQPLYEYLRDRHADRVVLTFAEIESLVGFSLPPAARAALGWWNDEQAIAGEAWGLADRSATVNLTSEVVLYERLETPRGVAPR